MTRGYFPHFGRYRTVTATALVFGLTCCLGDSLAQTLPAAEVITELTFEGINIRDEAAANVSGITLKGDHLILIVDEGHSILVLKRHGAHTFKASEEHSFPLKDIEKEKELDLEGVAWEGRYVFATGSHGKKRDTVKADEYAVKKNRKRIFDTDPEKLRHQLFRFEIDSNGHLDEDSIRSVSLRSAFKEHPILSPFLAIPSKENGVDIEAIAAVDANHVYLGFRGPVLRGGYALILQVRIEEKGSSELNVHFKNKKDLYFVNLGGRGIRDMDRFSDESNQSRFLILAGPVADLPHSFQVYEWNGRDDIPGKDRDPVDISAKALCAVPTPILKEGGSAKAEGITVLNVTKHFITFIIVYDGPVNGAPTLFTCTRKP